jgi:predicted RND superfamily exporter protein
MTSGSRSTRRWIWLLLLPVFAVLHVMANRLPVDRHNQAMRARNTPDAAAIESLRGAFGDQDPLVLAFRHRDAKPLDDDALDAIKECADELRSESGVVAVRGPMSPRPDVSLLQATLAFNADGAAVAESARRRCPPGMRLTTAGLPLIEQAIAEAVALDRDRVVPVIAMTLLVLLAVGLRSMTQAVCALIPAIASILLTAILRHGLGKKLDPISVLVDPVLLTVAVAASIHLLASFRRLRAQGATVADAASEARRELLGPALAATATTMLGFWSLSAHSIPAVADFGLFTAFGVAVAHALVMAMLPALLRDWAGSTFETTHLGFSPHAYVSWLRRNRRMTLAAALASALVAAHSLTQAKVDNDPLAVLPPDDPRREQVDELADILGGNDAFALLVDSSVSRDGPERTLLFAAAAAATAPAAGPAAPAAIGRGGLVMAPLLLSPSGSNARVALFDAIEQRAAALDLGGIRLAGSSVQIARDSERLVRGQFLGIAVTCALLGACLAVWLRSLRLALLGLVPNVLPCLWLYGGLAAADRPMSVASAMIGSVMLGLVVDNTIHVLHRYSRSKGSHSQRVESALADTAMPMTISSAVLAAGLGAGVVGGMQSTHEFAALAATTVGLAFLGDAVVLPALLLSRNQKATA